MEYLDNLITWAATKCTLISPSGGGESEEEGGDSEEAIIEGAFYVATDGNDSNPGSAEQPWLTWQKGFSTIGAGDTLYIRGGTYYATSNYSNYWYPMNSGVYVSGTNGTAVNLITVKNYPGETPVLDCSTITAATVRNGIFLLNCDYWYLDGLTVCNAVEYSAVVGAFGIWLLDCNYCTLDMLVSHDNGGSGIVITSASEENLIKNCDSYNNYDSLSGGVNSDGIEVSYITDRNPKRENTITGCRSWNNSDDGYDFYDNNGYLEVTNCWAWHNGFDKGGSTPTGDGNGFKLGKPTGTVNLVRKLTNCLAWDNQAGGITMEEMNLHLVIIYNCVAYANQSGGGWEAGFQGWNADNVAHILRNNISYNNAASDTDQFQVNYVNDHNSWNGGVTVTNADFMSVSDTGCDGMRGTGGALPVINFLRLATGSDLIDAGVDVGITYLGSAPDLGAFEKQ